MSNNVRIQSGDTERIEALILDGSLAPLTGKTDILISIRRVSDGFWYDFNDSTFKSSSWTTRQQVMSETDATNDPGVYHYNFISPSADAVYEIRVDQSPGTDAGNIPQCGEIKVGGFIDDLDATISSRSNHTASDVDTTLTSSHGSGSWQTGTAPDSATIAAAVWGHATRTLTSFGTLIADLWAYATRTLTAGTKDTEIDAIKTKTDQLDFTGTDVKATLDGEEVTTDTASRNASKADVSALAIEANVSANALAALNIYDPPTRTEATTDKNEIIAQIAALNNVSITDVQTAMTNQGYTTARAAYLDNLVTILPAVEKIRKITSNRVVINGTDTLVTVYEDDNITPAFTLTVSSDRRERTP
jgi:hypothetical protein